MVVIRKCSHLNINLSLESDCKHAKTGEKGKATESKSCKKRSRRMMGHPKIATEANGSSFDTAVHWQEEVSGVLLVKLHGQQKQH